MFIAESCESWTIKDKVILGWGDTDAAVIETKNGKNCSNLFAGLTPHKIFGEAKTMVYVIGIVAVLIILFGFLCYKKAPPTEAIVVTGFGLSKPKVVCGKGTFVLPVLQRADRLNMRLLKIDVKTPETGVKTKNGVSLWIDSVVTIQVYSENSTVLDEEVKASGLKDAKAYIMSRQQAAISNFLGVNNPA